MTVVSIIEMQIEVRSLSVKEDDFQLTGRWAHGNALFEPALVADLTTQRLGMTLLIKINQIIFRSHIEMGLKRSDLLPTQGHGIPGIKDNLRIIAGVAEEQRSRQYQ